MPWLLHLLLPPFHTPSTVVHTWDMSDIKASRARCNLCDARPRLSMRLRLSRSKIKKTQFPFRSPEGFPLVCSETGSHLPSATYYVGCGFHVLMKLFSIINDTRWYQWPCNLRRCSDRHTHTTHAKWKMKTWDRDTDRTGWKESEWVQLIVFLKWNRIYDDWNWFDAIGMWWTSMIIGQKKSNGFSFNRISENKVFRR